MDNSASIGTVVRWCARILGAGIILFWGYFLIAHLIGDAAQPSRQITMRDSVILCSLVVSLAGLAAAWKWELIGGIITLVAIGVGATASVSMITGPYILIPTAGMLFVVSGWMSQRGR